MKDTPQLIQSAIEGTAAWLLANDYAIQNESEFCNVFFHHLILAFTEAGRSPSSIRTEIKFRQRLGYKTRIATSIDFGIRRDPQSEDFFDALVEAKSWIRPTHIKGAFAPNSSSSKRNQCIADAKRLLQLNQEGYCERSALVIYEQSSAHLRRLVPVGLAAAAIDADALWINIGRASLGRRKEHVGLLWLQPVPSAA